MRSVQVFLIILLTSGTALADSSSPKLAAFYDRQMAIVAGQVYAWKGQNSPTILPVTARQVGVGRDKYYALTNNDDLMVFSGNTNQKTLLMAGIVRFSAGDSGVLAITNDSALWWLSDETRQHVATDVAVAAVGDGANY